jgi:hypothetical protein
VQRDRRPANLSISSNHDALNGTSAIGNRAQANTSPDDALPVAEATTRHLRNDSIPDFGITMTFDSGFSTSSPEPEAIWPGKPFTWEVFILNRSAHARKLAIVPIAKRTRQSAHSKSHSGYARPHSSYGGQRKSGVVDEDIADAVLDENVLHAMQKSAAAEGPDVLVCSTDVRVGPLAPNACHTVELKFMAMRAGVLRLEAVRVVDLGTNEHVDVTDLPVIVCMQADK